MSAALDLLEEFHSLAEIGDSANIIVGSEHDSIGGADLSGIPALDDDDDDDDDDQRNVGEFDDYGGRNVVKDSASTTAAIGSMQASASLLFDRGAKVGSGAGRKPERGGELPGLERGAVGSEAWDSSSDDASDGRGVSLPSHEINRQGAAAGPGASSRGVSVGAIPGGLREFKEPTVTAAESLASAELRDFDGGARDGGSIISVSSNNPNVASPRRPAEEGSDWDGGAGQSSDDAEGELVRWPGAGARGLDSCCSDTGNGKSALAPRDLSPPALSAAAVVAVCPPASGPKVQGISAAPASGDEETTSRLVSCATKPIATADGGGPGNGDNAEDRGESELVRRKELPSPPRHHRHLNPQLGEESCTAAARRLASANSAKSEASSPSGDEERVISKSVSGSSDGGNWAQEDVSPAVAATTTAPAALESRARAVAGEEVAAIEALRTELRALREHVIRSERRREEQLRELGDRLEAQATRRDLPPAAGGTGAAAGAGGFGEEEAETAEAEDGCDGMATRRYCRKRGEGGDRTPQGVVHNPFASAGGGAAMTPRDHFPAFEDALLHDGDEDRDRDEAAARGDEGHRHRGRGEEEGGGENTKSGLHSEAFDFSIDTLSHINNHTDFGTDAPVVAALPVAVAAVSPKLANDGRGGRGQRERSRLPWLGGEITSAATPHSGRRLKEGQEEETFDVKDAAAEEAFFSDACATASLQTPVKHLLAAAAAAAPSDLGVAARRGRAGGAGASSVSSPAARRLRRRNDLDACSSVGRPPHDRESTQSCGDRVLSLSDPQSPHLCMADFFARASAELERGAKYGGEIGWQESPAKRGISAAAESRSGAALFPPAADNKQRVAGIDAACQTTWSFSVHDEVRFASTPTTISTLIADERGCIGGAATIVNQKRGGSGLVVLSEDNLEQELGPTQSSCTPRDGWGGCFTPRQSRPPPHKSPVRSLQRKGGDQQGGEAGAIQETCSFFKSPNLSPIAAAAAAVATSAEAGDAPSTGAQGEGDPSTIGEVQAGGEGHYEDWGRGGGRTPRALSARWQNPEIGHGLSPILSEGRGSVSSRGLELGFRQAADSHAGDKLAGLMRSADEGDDGGRDDDRRRTGTSPQCQGDPPLSLPAGGAQVPKVARLGRSSGSGQYFMDSFVDVTRSSVLRASTTLDTMAPLDDTGLSFACSSRSGASYAGELFADSRLRAPLAAERIPRYDAFVPLGEEGLRRGGGGGGGDRGISVQPVMRRENLQQQQQQQQQQRRSRSAPTSSSEWSTSIQSSRSEGKRLASGAWHMPALEPASFGHGGGGGRVPPAVVGAWVAAAIEGLYSHDHGSVGAGGGGRCGATDRRAGTKSTQKCDMGLLVADAARQTLPTQAQNAGALAYAPGPGDSPPPPPPPPEPLLSGRNEETVDDEEAGHEENLFYQRQRLLQRVVSAAASCGGMMPSLSSVLDARRNAAAEEGEEEEEEGRDHREANEQGMGTGASKMKNPGGSPDPLSWKTPSVAASAAASAATAAAATTSGEAGVVQASTGAVGQAVWAVNGTPAAYMRRHTSGYWRDRLGVTH